MLSISEQLMHLTIRLECELYDGSISTGTGFLFSFTIDEETHIPLLVTNKHVVQDSKKLSFVLTKANNGHPIVGQVEKIIIEQNFDQYWILHPDPNIDLAVLPLSQIYRDLQNRNISIYAPALNETFIPDQKIKKSLSGINDIYMIGYPNGIWDSHNNMPIVRRGITATNVNHNYQGEPIFVIDCACFPGSSGSPIVLYDEGHFSSDEKGLSINTGPRLMLLGILFAGPQHTAQGEIHVIDTPLKQVPISLSRIPNNLGFVIQADKLLDFKKILHPES